MEDQLLFENLDEKLEDDMGPITANWISINFGLTIDNSRRLMKSYLQSRKDLSSVHLLSGISNSGEFLIKMARSDQILDVEKSFKHAPAIIVYSIQRQPCKSSISLADNDIIQNLTNSQVEKLFTILSLLITIPWSPQEPRRTPLSCRENQLDQKSDRLSEEIKSKENLESVSKHLTHSHADRIKTSSVKNFFTKSEKSKESAKPIEPKIEADNSIIIKNSEKELFNTIDQEDDEPLINVSSSKRKRVVIESDEDSDSPNEENKSQLDFQPKLNNSSSTNGISKSPMHEKKSKSYKKNKNQVLVLDSETDSPTTHSAKLTKKSIHSTHTHVSKLVESEIVKTVNLDRQSPKICEKDNRPKHIRHQVMKTFADEDGFMVTEKGWESVSDDEDSQKPVISTSKLDPESNSHSKTNNSTMLTGAPAVHHLKNNKTTSKKTLPKPGSKQISLSTFFKPKE